ncbi:transcription factor kayak-like [Brevipalpus obovatus]|uniref:transcription factor kayak-like n=1 Tax=Brevipalpus obovatus TaxID=246614 RepID=UPI003D9EDB57
MEQFGNIEYQYQAGFVPPPISPSYTSDSSDRACNSVDNSQEDQRKKLRRERNKEAAARCRKRRLEQTERLSQETEELAEGNRILRNELTLLEAQRDELMQTLQKHHSHCENYGNKNSFRE